MAENVGSEGKVIKAARMTLAIGINLCKVNFCLELQFTTVLLGGKPYTYVRVEVKYSSICNLERNIQFHKIRYITYII